ncbi:MAG TPA: hypothetical protein VLL25_14280 [Acidimicrobiales bacterium]|nr:hypothetical protein [Acidimicrobiales bacterium]
MLESRSLPGGVRAAVSGADITVVRLRVPLDELHAPIRHREADDPTWFLQAVTYLVPVMEHAGVEDHVVDNTGRPARETAGEVLRPTTCHRRQAADDLRADLDTLARRPGELIGRGALWVDDVLR